MAKDPLLLLDNTTLAYVLGNGEYRFTNLKFEEAKAIIEMKGDSDVVRVFANPDLEHTMYEYLEIENHNFNYQPENEMQIGQDAIAFKLYITPSGTQPIVLGAGGQEAKKIKNIYIYCQHVVRLK
ncbi:MAG: hypothetical protein LIP16_16010 [Clostridium sp.]|nr:hypothetical protein [Clostridium sp.]